MFAIEFYEDVHGYCEIHEFLSGLREAAPSNSNARIQHNQAMHCIGLLREVGSQKLPENIAKYIDDGIWELRPGNNRIFYFYYGNGTYILLHHYLKKSQKAPPRELKRAKREMDDYIARKGNAK